jgi:hypothetical protein
MSTRTIGNFEQHEIWSVIRFFLEVPARQLRAQGRSRGSRQGDHRALQLGSAYWFAADTSR